MKMKIADVGVIIGAAFVLVVLVGYVMNIVALVGMDWNAALGIEAILRIIGIPVAPIGSIMGLFV